MIKHYLYKASNNRYEAKKIDMETGNILHYMINNGQDNIEINFPFSFYEASAKEWGYESPAAMIKELKKRKILGEEVPHDRQKAAEISALLHLAKYRHDNGWKTLDISENLQKYYGLSKEYTEKILRYMINHNIERHIITVYTADNDNYTTEINGTPEEIEKHYIERIEFIA